jgi:hypothetical protein
VPAESRPWDLLTGVLRPSARSVRCGRAVGYTRSGVSSAESGGYAARHFYALCDDVLKTSGTLAAGYDAMSQQLSDAQAANATAEFGEPRMKVVVGYVRGSWHIELYLPEKPG